MFKSEQVSAEDEEYPIDVLIQQATFFGQFPLSYEDIIDAKQNQTLAAILYYIQGTQLTQAVLRASERGSDGHKEFICKVMKMDPRCFKDRIVQR